MDCFGKCYEQDNNQNYGQDDNWNSERERKSVNRGVSGKKPANISEVNETKAYFASGHQYWEERQYNQARDEFTRVLELDSNHTQARELRGQAYLALGANEEALKDLEQVTTKSDLASASAFFSCGEAHHRLGQRPKALECYNKAIELDNKNATAFVRRGQAHQALGNNKEAADDYQKVLNRRIVDDKLREDVTKGLGEVRQLIKIREYQENYNSYVSDLEKVDKELKTAIGEWKQFNDKISEEHKKDFEESQLVLDNYKRLTSDDNEYKKELKKIDDSVDTYLQKIEEEDKMLLSTKNVEQVRQWFKNHMQDIVRKKTIRCWEQMNRLNSPIGSRKFDSEECDNIMFDRLQMASKKFEESVSGQDQHCQVKSPVFDACLKSYINYLHAKMRKASITPEDKVYEQQKILRNFRLKKDSILNKERERLLSEYEPSIQRACVVLCSTYQLCENVRQVQNQCPELQKKVATLEKDIRQFYRSLTGLTYIPCVPPQNVSDQLRIFANIQQAVEQKLNTSFDLEEDLTCQLPKDYNPYYYVSPHPSKYVVQVESSISYIKTNRSGSCAIKTTWRGLEKLGVDISKLGTDIKKAKDAAAEEWIATTIGHNGSSTPQGGVVNAYKNMGFDYIHVKDAALTIDDIKDITEKGHVIVANVYKTGLRGHSLLIERVEEADNGYAVIFYDPYKSQIMRSSYRELKKVLLGYTRPSKEQMETRKPILPDPERVRHAYKPWLLNLLDSPAELKKNPHSDSSALGLATA